GGPPAHTRGPGCRCGRVAGRVLVRARATACRTVAARRRRRTRAGGACAGAAFGQPHDRGRHRAGAGELRAVRAGHRRGRQRGGTAFRAPTLPGGPVFGRRADRRSADRRAAAACGGGIPATVFEVGCRAVDWPADDGGVIAGWSGSMVDARFRTRLQDLLAEADIRIDGPRPWDLQIHEPDLPARLLAGGSLALGESYMDAAWDAASLDGFLHRLLAAGIDRRVRGFADLRLAVLARLFNLQRGRRSYEVGERHYDLGNELYAAMLGSRLVYSC